MCDVKNTENLSNIQFIYQMVQSDNMTLGNPLWKSRHSGYGGVSWKVVAKLAESVQNISDGAFAQMI